jgi:hypothetical protein
MPVAPIRAERQPQPYGIYYNDFEEIVIPQQQRAQAMLQIAPPDAPPLLQIEPEGVAVPVEAEPVIPRPRGGGNAIGDGGYFRGMPLGLRGPDWRRDFDDWLRVGGFRRGDLPDARLFNPIPRPIPLAIEAAPAAVPPDAPPIPAVAAPVIPRPIYQEEFEQQFLREQQRQNAEAARLAELGRPLPNYYNQLQEQRLQLAREDIKKAVIATQQLRRIRENEAPLRVEAERVMRQKELAAREQALEEGRKVNQQFQEFDAFFAPNPQIGANQRALEESMASFRANQDEINKSLADFEISMGQAEKFGQPMVNADPTGLTHNRMRVVSTEEKADIEKFYKERLVRDEAAGMGAGAFIRDEGIRDAPPPAQREASSRKRGLEPQLPMSIFAYDLPPNVTGRTKERRESYGKPRRGELSMSNIDIRDPTNDLSTLSIAQAPTMDKDLFANQSLSARNPDDLQKQSTPIRGWDDDISSISAVDSPYGGGRAIASAQSLEDTLSELEGSNYANAIDLE